MDSVTIEMDFIDVRIARVYGNLHAYPVSRAAKAFADIAGTRTLAPRVLKIISDLGLLIRADASSTDREEAAREWHITMAPVS